MATFSKRLLSGSTQGQAVKVAGTASPGTTIHVSGLSTAIIDEVWLYAYNSASSAVALTVQYAGTAAVDNDIKIDLPPVSGLTLIVPGLILTGSGSVGGTVAAYAGTANAITLSGYVNRIS